ncbi:hypothetical protein HCH_05224 [Hahella chejuensis KCTC 2396]|uniref:Uncharacterized protein n=1 Tax=Hahella chejuensis (strain KCTC 2396) TaxID=349521 RepID=Q2SBS5_HAHCH|nr:hypothetical protein HCH_05224 [Hahella chejuensis KCTC 2396]
MKNNDVKLPTQLVVNRHVFLETGLTDNHAADSNSSLRMRNRLLVCGDRYQD